MAQPRATGPYVWVTWLPRLLSGESSCEWASWFKAQHEGWSWSRMPSDFDQAGWLMNHTSLLNQQRQRWEAQGYTVLTEGQNSFNLRGSSAVLAGKPDLVARAQGPGHRHRREDGPSQSGPRNPGAAIHVRPPSRIGALPGAEHRRTGSLPRPRSRHPDRGGRREVRREPGRPHAASGLGDAGQAHSQPRGVPVLRDHPGGLPRTRGGGFSGGGRHRRLLEGGRE